MGDAAPVDEVTSAVWAEKKWLKLSKNLWVVRLAASAAARPFAVASRRFVKGFSRPPLDQSRPRDFLMIESNHTPEPTKRNLDVNQPMVHFSWLLVNNVKVTRYLRCVARSSLDGLRKIQIKGAAGDVTHARERRSRIERTRLRAHRQQASA